MMSRLLRRFALPLGVLMTVALLFGAFWSCTVRMPGRSFQGTPPALSSYEQAARQRIEADVRHLAEEIGERSAARPDRLQATADWIQSRVSALDLAAELRRRPYQVAGTEVWNLELLSTRRDPNGECVVVGAHYDSARGTPGANDNGSGVAVLLELARRFDELTEAQRQLRLVWFTHEEPPHFHTEDMGSFEYARQVVEECRVVAMLSLETLGFYSDEPGSQKVPAALAGWFPDRGNFVAFVGDDDSRGLVRFAVERFRKRTAFPSEGVAASSRVQGIGWSDHWSFWQVGVPALMVTDTAPFRDPHYHRPTDTPERLDYEALARISQGLTDVLRALLSSAFEP